MHVQGNTRRSPLARSDEIVRERIRPSHTYRVLEASAHHVTLEHVQTGHVDEFGRTEFLELFEEVC